MRPSRWKEAKKGYEIQNFEENAESAANSRFRGYLIRLNVDRSVIHILNIIILYL
jgi:hypothetical protein